MEQSSPKKAIWKRWWFWVGAVVLLFIIGASAPDKNSQQPALSPTQANQAREKATERDTVVEVSAEQLMRDYQANEVAADQKYKNMTLRVNGVVDSIGKDILDTPYVSLKTAEYIFGIQCMFDPSQSSQLATLTKGQNLVVEGKLSGKLGNVILKECKLQ